MEHKKCSRPPTSPVFVHEKKRLVSTCFNTCCTSVATQVACESHDGLPDRGSCFEMMITRSNWFSLCAYLCASVDIFVEHPVSNHRPGVQHSMMFCLPGIAGRWSISHAANITINSAVQPETAVHVQPQTCDFLTCTLSIHFRDLPADFLRSCHFLGGGKIRKICPCSAFWAILIGPDRS
jgi:hypothetical protein